MSLPRSYNCHVQLPIGYSRSFSVTQHYTCRLSSSSSNRSACWWVLLHPVLHLPLTSIPDDYLNVYSLFSVSSCKWICPRKRKIYLPPTDLATYQYVRPIYGKPSPTLSLQQSRCKIYDGTRQTEYQIHIQEGRVDKSLHQNYRKPSHVCVQSCHARKARSRHASSHQAIGIACTAIQITVLLHNLLIITIIWYLHCVFIFKKKFPDAHIVIIW